MILEIVRTYGYQHWFPPFLTAIACFQVYKTHPFITLFFFFSLDFKFSSTCFYFFSPSSSNVRLPLGHVFRVNSLDRDFEITAGRWGYAILTTLFQRVTLINGIPRENYFPLAPPCPIFNSTFEFWCYLKADWREKSSIWILKAAGAGSNQISVKYETSRNVEDSINYTAS